MELRGRATAWAAPAAVVLSFAVSGCGGGMSGSAGTKQAKEVRASAARTYWAARNGLSAAGYLDVLSTCEKYGAAQKKLLAEYAGGDSRDDYEPTSTADPTPVPTGFPTPD